MTSGNADGSMDSPMTMSVFDPSVASHEEDNERIIQLQALLQQRDSDLLLAAEIGESLLEQNRDLSKQLAAANSDIERLRSEVVGSKDDQERSKTEHFEELNTLEKLCTDLRIELAKEKSSIIRLFSSRRSFLPGLMPRLSPIKLASEHASCVWRGGAPCPVTTASG